MYSQHLPAERYTTEFYTGELHLGNFDTSAGSRSQSLVGVFLRGYECSTDLLVDIDDEDEPVNESLGMTMLLDISSLSWYHTLQGGIFAHQDLQMKGLTLIWMRHIKSIIVNSSVSLGSKNGLRLTRPKPCFK